MNMNPLPNSPLPSLSSPASPIPSSFTSTTSTSNQITHTTISPHVNLKEGITSALEEYRTTLKQLMDSLAIASRNLDPSTSEHVFLKLIEKDTKLQNYVQQLNEHQKFQGRLAVQQVALAGVGGVEHTLMQALMAQDSLIHALRATLRPEDRGHSKVLASEIVSYGHKISYTTSAPPGWVPSQVAVFKPPAPQEEQVRTGLLYSKIPDKILQYYSLEEPNKPQQTSFPVQDGLQQDTPAVLPEIPLNIPLPPKGWKAGMPILPLPPKGWKPGDQILGSAVLPVVGIDSKVQEGKSDTSSSEEDVGAADVEWE